MYRKNRLPKTRMKTNQSYIGETIEAKMRRILNNKEPISDGAPLIYTDRKMGVQPDYNIRTDRFDVAIDAMDKVSASKFAQREQRHKTVGEEAKEGMKKEGEGESKA